MKILDVIFENETLYSCIYIKNVTGNRKGQGDNPRAFKAMKGTQSKTHSQVVQINSNMCPSYINETEHRIFMTLSNLTGSRHIK